ncbi:short-chain dehydrogenase reductase family [Botrytis cinerea]
MGGIKDINFRPERDIPTLTDKVILVTGGEDLKCYSGRDFHEFLQKHHPSHIYFTGRNGNAASALIESIKKDIPSAGLTFLPIDLSSLSSIAAGIKMFKHDRLDIFMGNAGIMAVPAALSKDGYEIQFATNHLGNAAVLHHLLPIMLKTAELPSSDVRIVLNTSLGWKFRPSQGIVFDKLKTTQEDLPFGTWSRYGQSKVANILYVAELARRYPQITSVAVHPGVINTGLVSNLSFWHKWFVYVTTVSQTISVEQGIMNQTWAAAGAKKDELANGAFYMPVGVESNSTLDTTAKDLKLAKELWEWTEKALVD